MKQEVKKMENENFVLDLNDLQIVDFKIKFNKNKEDRTLFPVFTPYGEFEGWGYVETARCMRCGRYSHKYVRMYTNYETKVKPKVWEEWVIINKQKAHVSRSGLSKDYEIRAKKVFNPQWIVYPNPDFYPETDSFVETVGCNSGHNTFLLYEKESSDIRIRPTLCNHCANIIIREHKDVEFEIIERESDLFKRKIEELEVFLFRSSLDTTNLRNFYSFLEYNFSDYMINIKRGNRRIEGNVIKTGISSDKSDYIWFNVIDLNQLKGYDEKDIIIKINENELTIKVSEDIPDEKLIIVLKHPIKKD